MCGLAAFLNEGSVTNLQFIRDSLRILEYRGYDSCGYFIKRKNIWHKNYSLNKLDVPHYTWTPRLGLIHTRWADSGPATLKNAHPIQYENFFVVHNGNVQGSISYENIDTEIIAKALNNISIQHSCLSYPEMLYKLVHSISGDYAFAAATLSDDIILFAKTNKRLTLSADLKYLASDPACFDGYCGEYFELPDNCYGILANKTAQLYNFRGESILETLLGDRYQVHKKETESTMLDEIREQRNFVPRHDLKNYKKGKLTIFGCGSSYNAAVFAKPYLKRYDVDIDVEYSSFLRYGFDKSDQYLAISQSGETYDTYIAAAHLPKEKLALLTNNANSLIARMAGQVFNLDLGAENAVAATKTFTGSVLALCGMSIFSLFDKLWSRETFDNAVFTDYSNALYLLASAKHCFVFGDYWNFGAALEVALKFKEVAMLHAEAMVANEIKHGPICLTGPDFLNVFLTNSPSEDILRNMKQIKSRGGKILVIQTDTVGDYYDLANEVISLPDCGPPIINHLLQVVVAQKLSYDTALLKKLNPNRPVGLAKAITV